jgi:uncharacterized protein (TIRG00374 family)
MNTRAIGRVLRIVLTVAILALLVVFARKVNWHGAWEAMITASRPLLLAALVANLLTIVARAVRWWILLRAIGAPSLGMAIRASFAGAGLNNVLVANGGDVARVTFITRASGVPASRVIATAALDRLFDPIGFIFLLALGTLAFDLPHDLARFRWPALAAAVLAAALLVWLARSAEEAKPEFVPERRAVPRGWRSKLRAWLVEFGASFRELATGTRVVWIVVLTIIAWLTQVATFAFCAAAAHVPLPLAGTIAALLATNVSLIVRATPGNVGFFQFAYALATAPFGVHEGAAVGISVLIQALQIIPVTILGVALAPEFIFRRKKKKAPEAV